MSTDVLEVDFLVIGGGMAGMTAASFAASAGCTVLVAEKNPDIGGTAVLSGGKLWTGKTYELLDAETPGGDPALKRTTFEQFPRAVEWVRQSGVSVDPATPHLHYGEGHNLDIVGYIKWCGAAVTHAGGHIIRNATVDRLIVENGAVTGALIADRDGETEVRAPHTLLAAGGFSGSPALRELFIARQAGRALARCNPTNTGDGLRLGLAAGGALSPFMGGFYGHVMMHPVQQFGPREFRAYTQGGASVNGIMVNLQGQRFCDESLEDHRNAQEILTQPEARAVMFFDSVLRERIARVVLANTDTPTDAFQNARNEGGRTAQADRWEDLVEQVAAWGYDGAACLETIRGFNQAAAGQGSLAMPRRRGLRAHDQAPYYAVEGQTGVTATHGGLRIDAGGQVLKFDGTPVAGLHAAGADAGNMHGTGYAGGLAFAATFGLLAADRAIATAKTAR